MFVYILLLPFKTQKGKESDKIICNYSEKL